MSRFDMFDNTTTLLRSSTEPWKVTLVDTGIDTMTGGRIKRAARYLGEWPFLLHLRRRGRRYRHHARWSRFTASRRRSRP